MKVEAATLVDAFVACYDHLVRSSPEVVRVHLRDYQRSSDAKNPWGGAGQLTFDDEQIEQLLARGVPATVQGSLHIRDVRIHSVAPSSAEVIA